MAGTTEVHRQSAVAAVLVGFMTGIAIIMIGSQFGAITGAPVSGDRFVDQIRSFAAGVSGAHWPTIAVATSVLAMLVFFGWWVPRAPGPLIAVLVATAAVAGFSLSAKGIQVVGQIPAGLPTLSVPRPGAGELAALVIPAIGIAIVAFSDTVLTARAFASRSGQEMDANAELRALGLANVGAALTRGFPVSSSSSRTALVVAAGSRTQLYSMVGRVVVLAVMLFARGVLANFPTAALGALVVYAALRSIKVSEYRRLARFRSSELIIAVLTTVAVLGFGVLYGVLVAVGLSILDLLRRVAHAHDSVLGFVPGVAGMHDIDDYPEANPFPGLLIYRYDTPLCFANAEDLRRRAMQAADQNRGPVQRFVLNAGANMEVDLTALDALDVLREQLARRGIAFAMAQVKQDLRDSLAAAGLLTKVGEDRIFMTLPTAVEAFKRLRHD